MQLLDEHIDIITARLKTGGIKDNRLLSDLLDHICTYIEENDGDDFNALLADAFQLLAPNGVHEIEEERYFLFHFNKQLTMKRVLFFSGFASAFLVTTGLTFKLMHWPAATVILTLGYFAFLFTLVLIAVNAARHINEQSTAYRVRIFTGLIAASLICIGSIFKQFHLPSANIQFVLGIFLLNFIFLPMFFYQLYKRSIASI
jgi:hypothetical protein